MQTYDDLPKTAVKPFNEAPEVKTPFPPTVRVSAEEGFDKAARAYLEFRAQEAEGGARSVDAWCRSVDANRKHAELLRDLHRADPGAAFDLACAATELPEIGTAFLGFHLVGELGKGAFGKVYLAEQGDLANRPVALKVAANIVGEAHTLAQLQHTNIVPIYSVHRAGPFQAVCMPYFGATTLADVLEQVRSTALLPASGKIFVSTVNSRKDATSRLDSVKPSREPASPMASDDAAPKPVDPPKLHGGSDAAGSLQKLEAMSYVEAVLSIGASLADALSHAHKRGILHLDLKPANILLTDEGQPMLLDFNLSRDTKAHSAAWASVGGTLPYMAPEHLEAFRRGKQPVDARSDLFSLGVILYEVLTGTHPFPIHRGLSSETVERMIEDRRKPPPRLRGANPAVSPAAEAIVRRCLEPDPDTRYQTAGDLHEDLERQLQDLPLRHIPEPSLVERGRKWVRRHPRLTSVTSISVILGALILALATSLAVGQQRLARFQAADGLHQFDEEMRTAQVLLYGRNADRRQLEEGIRLAGATLGRYQVLDNPQWRDAPAVRLLPAEDRDRLQDEIGELLFLLARVTAQHAKYHTEPSRQTEACRQALSYNTLAETCYGKDRVPAALWEQRAALERQLGDETEAQRLAAKARQAPLRLDKDYFLLAHGQAIEGNYREAISLLQKATQKDPQNFSAWFVLGNCCYELGRNGDAVASYNTCIGLRPSFAWAWFNRGLAHLRLHHTKQACEDFDQVIHLDANLTDAYLNRAVAREEMAHYKEARDDLFRALDVGLGNCRIYLRLTRVCAKLGDTDGAKENLARCLQSVPNDEYDWIARGLAKKDEDPKGALADFDKALDLNPRSFEGLQNKAALLSDKLGNEAGALEVLDEAIQLYPDSVLARGGRGILLARQGKRDKALADAREALVLDPSPQTLYQVAGIFALTSKLNADDRVQAMHLLSSALRAGTGLEWVDDDHDLDPLREDAEFKRVVTAARALEMQAQGNGGR
jgi:serine/threonine protein kinase/Tfp pilus assembly protein PilF